MDQQAAPTTQLRISNVIYEHEGAIVFDGSAIDALKTAQEPCVILYLSQEDENNGFGTVIRLDPQTKQAAIFPDLNPEYTYLFYKDDQGHLQTLLRCIEFASRTESGQFIAHAKVHGQGLDLDELNQQTPSPNQPIPQHQLAESTTPTPSTNPGALTPQAVPTPSPIAGEQVLSFTPSIPQPTIQTDNTPAPDPAAPPVHHLSLPPQPMMVNLDDPEPAANQTTPVTAPMPTPEPEAQPAIPNQPAPVAAQPALAMPDLIPNVDASGAPTTGQAAILQPLTQPAPLLNESPTMPEPTFNPIPVPNPTLTDQSAPMPPVPTETMPQMSAAQPIQEPVQELTTPTTTQANSATPTPKNPVGRPPKPLIQDTAWIIEPNDFSWLKTMSRQPIATFKEELYEKMVHQIRQNNPELVDNWHFNNRLEQAFNAICTTYDLVPTSRQDLLRSLLNGRVINQVHQQLETGNN